jgi:hypothetical protein
MTPDKAYEEALRRIHEAQDSGGMKMGKLGLFESTELETLIAFRPSWNASPGSNQSTSS